MLGRIRGNDFVHQTVFFNEIYEFIGGIFSTSICPQHLHSHPILLLYHFLESSEYIKHFTFLCNKINPCLSRSIIDESTKVLVTSRCFDLYRTTNVRINQPQFLCGLYGYPFAKTSTSLFALHTISANFFWNVDLG